MTQVLTQTLRLRFEFLILRFGYFISEIILIV
jgi:hypothetical protein